MGTAERVGLGPARRLLATTDERLEDLAVVHVCDISVHRCECATWRSEFVTAAVMSHAASRPAANRRSETSASNAVSRSSGRPRSTDDGCAVTTT